MGRFKYSWVAIGAWAVFGAVSWWITHLFAPSPPSYYFALALWVIGVSWTLKWFTASVPQQTALVLVNSLSGSLREVPSGLSFKLPWEHAPLPNYLELQTLSVEVQGDFVASDGPVVAVKGTVQFRIKPGKGVTVVGYSEKAFFEGIRQVCASFLSDYLSKHSAIEVRSDAKILEGQLLAYLKSGEQSLQNNFGVEAQLVSIADIAFEEDYQRIRTDHSTALELVSIAKRLRVGEMTEAEALQAAMILSGDIKKKVIEINGLGPDALSKRLIAIAESLNNPA
jgi:regulator of protease activity HflC (stomatin/prohibitin superfamily)